MKIDRNNYESFFVDYLEGNLDEKLVDDFIEFITQNPDLKEELALFEPVAIDALNIEFGKKELLYKERFDLENEFNEAAIAALEGDLTENDKIEFENYITKHPERKPEVALFEKTRLIADQSVVFQKKNTLYKTAPIKTFLLWSGRVAALLVIAMLAYYYIGKNEKSPFDNSKIAVIENNNSTNDLPAEINKDPENNIPQVKDVPVTSQLKAAEKEAKQSKTESLRENFTAPDNQNDFTRTEIETIQLAQIERVQATIAPELPEAELAAIRITIPSVETPDEYLLVDRIKDKTGFEKINFKKITQAGLNLVASLSNEKFRYQTNETGKVTEIIYDSRLLAFTIPTTRNNEEPTGE